MPPVRRLFVGAFPPADVALALRDAVAGLDARLAVAEDIHLTLHFLGPTPEARIESLVELRIRGTGAFPDFERPRVLWIGVEEAGPAGRLLELARCVGNEETPWTPHLSVARPRGRGPFAEFRALRLEFPWTLAEVHLVESRAAGEGLRRYHSAAGFRLQPKSV